jgi:exosortase E/protease (VPEID-CTERM system)
LSFSDQLHVSAPVGHSARYPYGLVPRLVCLGVLFGAELSAASGWFRSIAEKAPFLVAMGNLLRPAVWQAIVAFAAFFLAFGYVKSKNALVSISEQVKTVPVRWPALVMHAASVIAFTGLSSGLLARTVLPTWNRAVAGGWLLSAVLGIISGLLAFIPLRVWRNLVLSTGIVWLHAGVATTVACLFVSLSRLLWKPAVGLTFELVRLLLRPFLPDLIANPASLIIGSSTFKVWISRDCSGLEGIGLILVFSAFWLWLERRECRFPRSLLLIPAGVCIIYLLNAVRIASLILIGNAGARSVALGGFHSEAGWISFNAVALGITVAAGNIDWLRRNPAVRDSRSSPTSATATAAYLMPFLAILAAGMVARAGSGTLEWLYPLRFVAAVAGLYFFRSTYFTLDWRFGWFAPIAGCAAFVIWLILDQPTSVPMPTILAGLPAVARITWLVFRTLAAVVTVPIAEELAFRGFLMRRLVSKDFETVGRSGITWVALLISSAGFGVLHDDHWLAGTVAGILYGLAWRAKGRIGDAVVAHAVTNALIALAVLVGGQWHLW